MERIIKTSPNTNFFLIANLKFLNYDFDRVREFKRKFAECDRAIKNLVENFDLKIYYINLLNLKDFKNPIRKFFSLTFIKKGVYNNKITNKKKNLIKDKLRRSMNLSRDTEESNEMFGKNKLIILII